MPDSSPPQDDAPKRFRSPPYPSINLAKAIERAKQLHKVALDHAVGAAVLADAWDYTAKSSGLWATAAAMLQFGLLTDEGTGAKRKFQLTESAIRIVRDTDPESMKRQDAVRRAALLPMIHRELWDKFRTCDGVSDLVVQNYLTLDRRDEGKAEYSDASAGDVIRSYKDTISFAGLFKNDTLPASSEVISGEPETDPSSEMPPTPKAKIGDYVQWTSGGVDQFNPPRRVDEILDGGSHLRVFGSLTGVPMSEVHVVDRPVAPPIRQGGASSFAEAQPRTPGDNELNVLLKGDRLQITADLNATGIAKLKDVLTKYEEILKLLG